MRVPTEIRGQLATRFEALLLSPLRWTTKSLRHLAEELTRQGHPVSAPTVGRLLRREGFSLQANAKTLEGAQHPDRDAQFRYLNQQVKGHQADDEPVVSVDTKKREQLGRLPMAGREWHPKGQPVKVEDHHFFTGPDVEQAIPTGSTTSPATPAGSTSASTTTPPRSRWSPSAAGGRHAEAGTTRRRRAC
jgi:hypothetical protein